MAVQEFSASAKLANVLTQDIAQRAPQSFAGMAFAHLRRDRLTLAALFIIITLALCALFAPLLASLDPNLTNPDHAYAPAYVVPYISWRLGIDAQTAPILLGKYSGSVHWLGADNLGRDQFSRLLYGGRISLSIAFVAALVSMFIGVLVGGTAGYFGGRVDDFFMWVLNTVNSVPTIYLLITICAIFTPSPTVLILFLGLLGWFGTARFMRGNVLKVRTLDYALAARATGATHWRILLSHIIPNSLPVIIVITAIDVGSLILTESTLSFIGLGVQPPSPTWGNMLNRARDLFFLRDPVTKAFTAFHLMWPPGLLISLSVLCFYLIGDGLRDALDPMMKNKK